MADSTLRFSQFFVVNEPLSERELRIEYTRHIIHECGGNISKAARVLGVDRRTMYRRLEEAKEAKRS